MIFLLFFSVFGVYLYSLPGTISSYRDSGDLISAASTFGIAHPPGYPTYVIPGRLWCGFFPWATASYGLNVFSALAIALAVVLLLKLFMQIFQLSAGNALVIVLFFSLTPAVWSLGQVSEMYALASLFAVGILYAAYFGYQILAWFLMGLGLGVHPTLILLIPFLVGRKQYRASLFAFGMGLSVFLFLPLRASMDPLQNWGNPSTWRNFWRVLFRADYGGLRLHPVESQFVWSPTSILDQLVYFLTLLVKEWGWIGISLAFWGMVQKKSRRLLLSFLWVGPVFFVFSNLPLGAETTPAILQPYLVLVTLLGVLCIGSGVNTFPAGWRILFLIGLLGPFVFACPVIRREDYYAYDYGRNLLRLLPPNAVLYEPDDPTTFTLRMFQVTEKRRLDLVLLNFFRTRWGYEQLVKRTPNLLPPVSFQNAQDLEHAFWTYSIHQRPFYAELPQKLPKESSYTPQGLIYRLGIFPLSDNPFAFIVLREHPSHALQDDFFTRHLLNYYASAYCNTGLAWANQKQWAPAQSDYFKALVIDPALTAAYNDLGILEFSLGYAAEARQYYEQGLKYAPQDPTLHENLNLLDSSKKQLKS